jgi:hypothetical protein
MKAILVFFIFFTTQVSSQSLQLEVLGESSLGIPFGSVFSDEPTVLVSGNTTSGSFGLALKQGDEGSEKGIYLSSPNSNSSARLFLEDNVFSIGRANSVTNLTLLNFNVNGNIGINETAPRSKLHLKEGDIYLEEITKGIIMKSPDGNCWRITPNNSGTLDVTGIGCP